MRPEYYYYGQGEILVARRTALADATTFLHLMDVSALTLALQVEAFNHRESRTGNKGIRRRIVTGRDGTANMTVHQIDPENLALCTQSEVDEVASGSFSGFELPEGLQVGDVVMLPEQGVSDLVLVDSATPTPEPVDIEEYFAYDPRFGSLELIEPLTGFDLPIVAAGEHAGGRQVGLLTNPAPHEVALRYHGINLAEGGAPVLVELYRCSVDPLSELQLINNDQSLAGMPVALTIMADSTKPVDSVLGQFGRVKMIPVAED